jgi:hypothetical protein
MKHATAATLAALQPVLDELRGLGRLVERTPGAFYLRSKAFLHFHEDASGLYADLKLDPAGFTRLRVMSPQEQAQLLRSVRRCLE